jgi:hypothetical protein
MKAGLKEANGGAVGGFCESLLWSMNTKGKVLSISIKDLYY